MRDRDRNSQEPTRGTPERKGKNYSAEMQATERRQNAEAFRETFGDLHESRENFSKDGYPDTAPAWTKPIETGHILPVFEGLGWQKWSREYRSGNFAKLHIAALESGLDQVNAGALVARIFTDHYALGTGQGDLHAARIIPDTNEGIIQVVFTYTEYGDVRYPKDIGKLKEKTETLYLSAKDLKPFRFEALKPEGLDRQLAGKILSGDKDILDYDPKLDVFIVSHSLKEKYKTHIEPTAVIPANELLTEAEKEYYLSFKDGEKRQRALREIMSNKGKGWEITRRANTAQLKQHGPEALVRNAEILVGTLEKGDGERIKSEAIKGLQKEVQKVRDAWKKDALEKAKEAFARRKARESSGLANMAKAALGWFQRGGKSETPDPNIDERLERSVTTAAKNIGLNIEVRTDSLRVMESIDQKGGRYVQAGLKITITGPENGEIAIPDPRIGTGKSPLVVYGDSRMFESAHVDVSVKLTEPKKEKEDDRAIKLVDPEIEK